jgi:hypothetical protein
MTVTTKKSGARGRSGQRRRKSAAWKSSLLVTGLGAVAFGAVLFAGGDTEVAASTTSANSNALLAQTQKQLQADTLSQSGDDFFWFNNELQDDSGFLVSPNQSSRSGQFRGRNGATGQFVRPMTRTRGS